MKERMNERQRRFCRFCAEGAEPKEAAEQAGYRRKGIEKMLLASGKIQRGIAAERERRREECPADGSAGKEEILGFLTELMRDGTKTDVKTRMRAAEILGKRTGAFEKDAGEAERSHVVIVDDIP